MQFIVLFSLLCLLVLERTIDVTSVASIIQRPDYNLRRIHVARRLRAPLMGRSIATKLNDDISLPENDLHASTGRHENEFITVDKRRFSIALLGGRRWTNSKRRGPLFG